MTWRKPNPVAGHRRRADVGVHSFSPSDTTSRQLDYSSFVKEVTQEQIREVRMDGKVINGVKRTGERFTTIIPAPDPQLLNDMLNHNVKVMGEKPEEPSLITSIFISWFPMLLLIGVWVFFMRQMQGGGGKGCHVVWQEQGSPDERRSDQDYLRRRSWL